MRWIRLGAIVFGCLAFGTIFGPLLLVTIAAATSQTTGPYGEVTEASRLIDAYRSRSPTGNLFLTLEMPMDDLACGYDFDQVFPDNLTAMTEFHQMNTYSDFEGYYALLAWRGKSQDEDWLETIAVALNDQMSPFELGFLRRCIEATLFSSLCMNRVERYGDAVPRFDQRANYGLAAGDEQRVICTFIDGVAARRGIPLSGARTGEQ